MGRKIVPRRFLALRKGNGTLAVANRNVAFAHSDSYRSINVDDIELGPGLGSGRYFDVTSRGRNSPRSRNGSAAMRDPYRRAFELNHGIGEN